MLLTHKGENIPKIVLPFLKLTPVPVIKAKSS